nr:MAG TPA: Lysozyme [Caudoviricetes sp.]
MDKRQALINMILENEGGYVDDPLDSGGRTYKGISEANFPNWKGWKIIDKHEPLKRGEFIKDEDLDEEIFDFYLIHFYYKLKLDQIHNLYISAHLLDHGVNAGISNGVKCLQRALNKILPIDIVADGKLGPITIGETNSANPKDLLFHLIEERENYYKNLVQKAPKNKKFLNGWLNRVSHVTNYINNIQYGM